MKNLLLSSLVISSSVFGQLNENNDLKLEKENEALNLLWQGNTGSTYFLQYSSNLTSWNYIPAIESGQGEPISFGFELDTDKMFYRLHYTDISTADPYEADFDGDSLSNWEEIRQGGSGTDPFIEDTDGNGMRDDGLVYGAVSDPDGFGLDPSLSQNLLARWDFEPTGGKSGLEDMSGNNRSLTLIGQVASSSFAPSAMVSYSAEFDNGHFKAQAGFMRDDRFNSSIEIRSKMTVSFWFKMKKGSINNAPIGIWNTGFAESYFATIGGGFPSSWVDNRTHGINVKKNVNGDELWAVGAFTFRNDHDGNASSYVRMDPFAANPATGTLDGNEIKWVMPAGTSDGEEKWMHMVLVRDRTSGSFPSGRTAVYINGELVAEGPYKSWALANQGEWNDASCQTFLGQLYSNAAGQSPANSQFKGAFDRFRIYGKALSEAQIEQLYKQDIDQDGLWDFSEQESVLWRDNDGDGLKSSDEFQFGINPFSYSDPDTDHDGDGLASIDEQNMYFTSIANPDSDGDLMPDGWEKDNGLDPLNPSDASQDGDSDGVQNLDEYSHASDPTLQDTDGDGVWDGVEITQGSLPSDVTDGGMTLDNEEGLSILLGVGDQSGSHSEDYVMNVFEVDAVTGAERRIHTVRSGGHGQYLEETPSFFKRDRTYSFQIDWQSSNLGNSSDVNNPEGADFDYTFRVEPVGVDSGIILQNYDPEAKRINQQAVLNILGNRGDVTDFLTSVEPKRVLRVVMGMTPDYNRDGIINDADRGKVTQTNPYRFWVNDDNDKEHEERKVIGGADIPSQGGSADSNDFTVDGLRDLIDFFPLELDLEMMLKLFPKENGHTYRLRHSQTNFRYFLWSKGVADGSVAGYSPRDMFQNSTRAKEYAKWEEMRSTRNESNFYHSELKAFEQGKGIMMMEANAETAYPLILEVENTYGVVAEVSLPVSMSGVEKMYRHANLRSAAGGTGGRATQMGEPVNYPDDQTGLTSDKWFVLLHGYNVNGDQARGWHAEFFKRMWWSGSKAKFVGVSWRGEESQLAGVTPNYHVNVVNALNTADELAATLVSLGQGEKSISAHSLGNMVASAAITDYDAPVTNYLMFDAAVAIESYDAGAEQKATMKHPNWILQPFGGPFAIRSWASEWHQLPWSQSDARKSLTWRGRLQMKPSVTYYNFYSSGEEVLREHTEQNALNFRDYTDESVRDLIFGNAEVGLYTWMYQELLKGRMLTGHVLGSRWGGWGFNIARSSGFDPLLGAYWTAVGEQALSEADLMSNPYWRRGGEDVGVSEPHPGLFASGAAGSGYASLHKSTIIAEAIPALTLPAGANSVAIFEDQGGVAGTFNFDMMNLKDGWYQADGVNGNPNWRHGDIKDVAYPYTHRIYDEFVTKGKLYE